MVEVEAMATEILHPFGYYKSATFNFYPPEDEQGWASPFQDQKTVNLERNKSLTKEVIENFHRWQKASKHQHHQHDKVARPQSSFNSPQFIFQWSRCPVDLEKACKTCDWWTQSNWAFLNEPPQEKLKSASNYAAQFHVAQFPANKCTPAN